MLSCLGVLLPICKEAPCLISAGVQGACAPAGLLRNVVEILLYLPEKNQDGGLLFSAASTVHSWQRIAQVVTHHLPRGGGRSLSQAQRTNSTFSSGQNDRHTLHTRTSPQQECTPPAQLSSLQCLCTASPLSLLGQTAPARDPRGSVEEADAEEHEHSGSLWCPSSLLSTAPCAHSFSISGPWITR